MPCTLYRWVHVPAQPDSPDHHHLVPRAWQAAFQPPPLSATSYDKSGLWDHTTVEVCPNCHRRIHEAIVRIMHGGPKRRDAASKVAQRGIDAFVKAGGSLDALRAAGLWGEQ